MTLLRDLWRQTREVLLSIGVLGVGVTIFLGLLMLVVVVRVLTNGFRCDTYTTERLAEWFGFVAERCAQEDKTP